MTLRISALIAWTLGLAYAQPLAFEVASIKPSSPVPGPNDRTAHLGNGKYTGTGINLLDLLATLNHFEAYQVVGGPRWLGQDRYDIAAKGDANATNEEVTVMIQTLLADRCKLISHREILDLPVYALVVDKAGPKMQPSAPDAQYSFRIPAKGHWIISRITLLRLARSLTGEVGRTVVDLTGLTEYYDVTLEWTPDQITNDTAPTDSSSSSIFTAVRDQLGLRLESRKLPTEVLVIDHVEKPSEN
jgi:uncharacterized protein (TIGR03435 family)